MRVVGARFVLYKKTKHKISHMACLKVNSSMCHTFFFFFDRYTLLMKLSVVLLIKLCIQSVRK